MDLKLHDKTCLVTGASRGIGRGIAKVLAAEGCRVAVVARRGASSRGARQRDRRGRRHAPRHRGRRPHGRRRDGAHPLPRARRVRRRARRARQQRGQLAPRAVERHRGAVARRHAAQLRARAPAHESVHSDDARATLRPHHQHHGRERAARRQHRVGREGCAAQLGEGSVAGARAGRHHDQLPSARAHQQRADSRIACTRRKRTGARSSTRTSPSATSASPRTWRTSSRSSPRRWRATSRARSSTSTAACIVSPADALDRG